MGKKIKKLCIISNKYPSINNPVYIFVDQLVNELADNGLECYVISPISISNFIIRNSKTAPRQIVKYTKNSNKIMIYRPRYISFSKSLLKINTTKLTYDVYKRIIIKEIEKRNLIPDAIYGHFISSGMIAAEIGEMLNIPSFLAYGESTPNQYINDYEISFLQEKLSKLSGVISVSTENKRELVNLNLIGNPDIIEVFPNGIDSSKFLKIDKSIARERLRIPSDLFVVAFVGSFIERKGINILSQVLNELNDVYSIFIGKGPQEPNCKNILFKGVVVHEDIYLYLNAADVFVLPTQAEGCCNAIIEAMACGLPIISSDQPFNDDILNIENSIRLNVMDKEAIKNAIITLRDDRKLLIKMGEASLAFSSNFDIKQRALNIIKFMESRI